MSSGFITALCVAAISLFVLILISRAPVQTWKSRLSSFLMVILVLGAVMFMLYESGIFGRNKISRNFHVDEFETARAFVFGKFISEAYPGLAVVIATGTDDGEKKLNDLRIESLKKGLGADARILAVADFKAERNKQGYLQYSGNVTSIDFDLLLNKYRSCGILLSILPLPNDYRKMKMFSYSESERVGLAVLNGIPEKYTAEVRKGNISAFTCFRPMWTYSPAVPADPVKAFESRYLLVYPDNVDDMIKRYPNLFKK